MFSHSTNTFFSVLIAALIFLLLLAGVAAAQTCPSTCRGNNTALGPGALQNNANTTVSASNTAIGFNALLKNDTGGANTATGANALQNNTTGTFDTAIGFDALQFNISGRFNTAIGGDALLRNTTGEHNTATGTFALSNNITGSNNTAIGDNALFHNATGISNTAIGANALLNNNTTGSANTPTGSANTAIGDNALFHNNTGISNTAIGAGADVAAENLVNATAIGQGAIVDAGNKIRLGNSSVTVIEGQVAFTAVSDKTKKENFKPVDGEAVLEKIHGFELTSWNFIGHDPKEFRHYGPMAQDFFAAFGHDGVGQIGSETTINSGDLAGILMIAVQALEKRTAELKQKEAQIAELAARLEALELRQNPPIQITVEKPWVFAVK
jgi:acetyltransferase-like isoleucine patch superfamily enzyme